MVPEAKTNQQALKMFIFSALECPAHSRDEAKAGIFSLETLQLVQAVTLLKLCWSSMPSTMYMD